MGESLVFLLYCGLIISVPALLSFQSIVSSGLVLIVAAIGTVLVAATSHYGGRPRLARRVGPLIPIGLTAALLIMLLQTIPLPGGLSINPIWSSSATALGEKPAGSVTIDMGETVLAICQLTGIAAIALLAVLIAQHRRRAEMLLSVLAGVSTLVSLERIASSFPLPEALQLLPPTAYGAAETIGMFGFVLVAAVVVRGYEQLRPSRSRGRKPCASGGIEVAAALAASLINLVAVVSSGDPNVLFAALFGAGLLLAVLIVRRKHLDPWGQAGTAALLALTLATFAAFIPGRAENELITRMTDDAGLLGTGAGTVAALAPIYSDWPATPVPVISAAAKVTIEMGRPFLWLIVLIAAAMAAILLRGALQRGRDFVYAAAGAGCIAAILISALSSAGGLSLASSVILSATLGLAIAQSKGETSSAPAISAPRQSSAPTPDSRSFEWRYYGTFAVLGLLLIAQGIWILLPEVSRPTQIGFPSDQRHATVARQEQERANRSAVLAIVRGDLWAETAFSYASMLWTDQALELEESGDRSARTLTSLLKTLHYAPHRGDVWLMLACTCERLKMPTCNVGALLKMSYYTAPRQAGLLPLRLARALRSNDVTEDDELADMVRRDIRFVLTQSPDLRPALIAAYRSASSAGKRLVEQTTTPVDPAYLTVLRADLS